MGLPDLFNRLLEKKNKRILAKVLFVLRKSFKVSFRLLFRTLDDFVGGFSFPAPVERPERENVKKGPRTEVRGHSKPSKYSTLAESRKDLGVPFDGDTLSELLLQGMSKFPKHVTKC